MRNEEIKSELSALRADVLALAEARKQSEPPAAIQEEADGEPEDDSEAAAEHEGFMGHVQELVAEIREMALAELQADADEIKEEYDRIADRVRKIEHAVSGPTGSGSSLSKLAGVSPVVELAVHALKSKHGKK